MLALVEWKGGQPGDGGVMGGQLGEAARLVGCGATGGEGAVAVEATWRQNVATGGKEEATMVEGRRRSERLAAMGREDRALQSLQAEARARGFARVALG